MTTSSSCLCAARRLLTVRETADLPVMEHVSAATLYRLIEAGAFPARRISARKTLVLVTEWCPVHERKTPDDIDAWLDPQAA